MFASKETNIIHNTVVVPLYRMPSLVHRRPQRTFALFRVFLLNKSGRTGFIPTPFKDGFEIKITLEKMTNKQVFLAALLFHVLSIFHSFCLSVCLALCLSSCMSVCWSVFLTSC